MIYAALEYARQNNARIVESCLLAHSCNALLYSGGKGMSAKETILHHIQDLDEKLVYIARQIWEYPEIALQETAASRLLADALAEAGFTIEWGTGQMPTASSPPGVVDDQ
jgi:hypothetical protein